MKVYLIAHSPMPENTVAAAAKLCYSQIGVEDISATLTPEKTADFIAMLTEIGHESPIEHISFTFAIEGVSRSLLAQITRHRIASFSVRSQRYVKEGQFEYVIPPEIESHPEAKELFAKAMQQDQEIYDKLTDVLFNNHYQQLRNSGKTDKEAKSAAEKKAIEDARFVLPNACETKIVMTMNARSLLNFFRHRCCNRAQWEIKALADEMLKLVHEAAPNIFKNSGASCVKGACPEGKMTCGKIPEVREFYKRLKEGKAVNHFAK